jgi:uncharacterized membrane protein
MKTPSPVLSIAPRWIASRPGYLARFALGLLIPTLIVAAALTPKGAANRRLGPPPALHPHWPAWRLIGEAGPAVQLHLLCVTLALGIGGALLIGVKGDRLHRAMGWTWVLAMMTAAISSLFIRQVNHGAFSFIHLISGWIILAAPMAVAFARRHKVRQHARLMTGLFTGGLILAGLLAFMPGRLMWNLVLG